MTLALDKTKFAAVWADLKAIEGATSVGVTYPQFGPLVQKLVTDVSLLPQSNVTPEEKAAEAKLAAVAKTYSDSYTFWGGSLGYPDTARQVQVIWATASKAVDALAPDLAP
jgi:hypothetical protein